MKTSVITINTKEDIQTITSTTAGITGDSHTIETHSLQPHRDTGMNNLNEMAVLKYVSRSTKCQVLLIETGIMIELSNRAQQILCTQDGIHYLGHEIAEAL